MNGHRKWEKEEMKVQKRQRKGEKDYGEHKKRVVLPKKINLCIK
jgi:hypothetical protein